MKSIFLSLAAGCCFISAAAFGQVDLDAVKSKINENWSKNIPTFPAVSEVRVTPINGLYEVVVDGEVFYTDQNGDYLVMGELMDLKGQRNMTRDRQESLIAKIDFAQLNFDHAVVIKRGTGERKLVIFEDPNCSFCHKLARQMVDFDNVTIYIFLYPILSDDSHVVAQSIWCAENRAKAWEDWMVRDIRPAAATCDGAKAVLDANIELARGYGVKGTPTLVFTDGSRFPGAVDVATIEAKFVELAQ